MELVDFDDTYAATVAAAAVAFVGVKAQWDEDVAPVTVKASEVAVV